jgi:hypothetical protein
LKNFLEFWTEKWYSPRKKSKRKSRKRHRAYKKVLDDSRLWENVSRWKTLKKMLMPKSPAGDLLESASLRQNRSSVQSRAGVFCLQISTDIFWRNCQQKNVHQTYISSSFWVMNLWLKISATLGK